MSSDSDRRLRAEHRRRTAVLRRATLGGIEPDPLPLSGPEAVSLVGRLTQESWTAAGLTFPRYSRDQIPLQIGLPPRRVDIINRADGVSFDEAIADGSAFTLEGRRIPVIGRAALIKNKRAAGRAQDAADVEALAAQSAGEKNSSDRS